MVSPIVVDTGPLVALLDRRDTHHAWAADQLRAMRQPMITCEAVISEAVHLLRRCDPALEKLTALVREDIVRLSFSLDEQIDSIATMLRKYQDTPMSLADACVVRLSELHAKSRVFTVDSDFLHYRRNGRQTIPLLYPANS